MPRVYGVAEEIVDYLVTEGVGVKGSTLFMNTLPPSDSHPNVISVFETSGTPNIESSVTDYRFQVIVRNTSTATGRALSTEVHTLLHNKNGFLAESSVSLCTNANFPPILSRNPENEKWEFSMNFTMTLKEVFA